MRALLRDDLEPATSTSPDPAPMPRLLPLALLLLTAPPAAAQPQWAIVCSPPPWDAGPFELDADAPGCVWDRTDGGETVRLAPSALEAFGAELTAVTRWFRTHRFREPLLRRVQGRFAVDVYAQGATPCVGERCYDTDAPVFAVPASEGVDRPLRLFVRSDVAAGTASATDRAGVYSLLMEAVYSAYWDPPFEACPTACWIDRAIDDGFARWWLRTRHQEEVPIEPAFGVSLPQIEAAGAGPFWTHVAFLSDRRTGTDDGFAFARPLFEELGAIGSGAGTEAYLVAVDQILRRDDVGLSLGDHESGLSQAYALTIANLQWLETAPRQPTLTVRPGETETRQVTAHPPLGAVRIPVEIPGLDGLALIRVFVDSAAEGLTVSYRGPGGVGLNYGRRNRRTGRLERFTDSSDVCSPDDETCEIVISIANAHPERPSVTAPESYTVEVQVEPQCALPGDARGVVYAVEGPNPQTGARGEVARVTFDVAEVAGRGRSTVNRVEGSVSLSAGLTVTSDFEARLTCGTHRLALTDLAFSNEALATAAGPLGSTLLGPRLRLPTDVAVGDVLRPVAHATEFEIGGDAALRSGTILHDLRVTGRDRVSVPGAGHLDVWVVEGSATGSVRFEDGLLTALEAEGAVFDGDLDRQVQDVLRDAGMPTDSSVRGTASGLLSLLGSGEPEPTPFTVWYAPGWGAVQTTTGTGEAATTSRLAEVRRE